MAFPSNTNAVPVEILEGDGPVVCEKKELIPDSAGAGRHRGGLGQRMVIRVREDDVADGTKVIASAKGGRFHHPVPGILGGHAAPKGAIIAKGETLQVSGKQVIMDAGDALELKLPGGGGYGDPLMRDYALIEDDLRNGLVTQAEAAKTCGVVVDANGWTINRAASDALRASRLWGNK